MSTTISSCPIDAVLEPADNPPDAEVYALQRRVKRLRTGITLLGCVTLMLTISLAFLQTSRFNGLAFGDAAGHLFQDTAFLYVQAALIVYVAVCAFRMLNLQGSKVTRAVFKYGSISSWAVFLVAYGLSNALALAVLNAAGLGAVGVISMAVSVIAFVSWFIVAALCVASFILESERLRSVLAWYDAHEETCPSCQLRS